MTSSLTPSLIWDVLSRLGPEDALMAVELPTNSSGMSTAGADFGIVKGPLDDSKLYYKDVSETQRFAAMVESDRCVDAAHTHIYIYIYIAYGTCIHPPPRPLTLNLSLPLFYPFLQP